MTATSARPLRVAAALLAVALAAAGCGSSAASAPTGPTSPAGVTPTGAPNEVPSVGTTPDTGVAPSSDVQGSTDLTSWLTQVCTAASNTALADDQPDLSKITTDPQLAMQNLIASYTKLGAKLTSMADELEQIGAPDIPNGKQFTDTYIDVLHQLGAFFSKVAGQLPANATSPQQALAALKELDTPQLQAQIKRLKASYKLIDTDQITQLGKTIPECKKFDFGSGD